MKLHALYSFLYEDEKGFIFLVSPNPDFGVNFMILLSYCTWKAQNTFHIGGKSSTALTCIYMCVPDLYLWRMYFPSSNIYCLFCLTLYPVEVFQQGWKGGGEQMNKIIFYSQIRGWTQNLWHSKRPSTLARYYDDYRVHTALTLSI